LERLKYLTQNGKTDIITRFSKSAESIVFGYLLSVSGYGAASVASSSNEEREP
jgi:hypothetical protein